jgi:hypothetical protein
MIDHTRLAADFCESIRKHLTTAQLAAVNLRNAAETDPAIDHVHDFIGDANECMYDALQKQHATFIDVDNLDTTWRRARLANYQLRRVLVACEFSRIVSDRIAAYGHSVISCDIIPAESPGHHYIGDVRDIVNDGWTDMLAFPPCTFLCNSGVKHLVRNGQRIDPARWQSMQEGAEFFRDLGAASIERIARENSIMHKYAVDIIGRRQDQIIQPHEFGNDASKQTCLWLNGLPVLLKDAAQYIAPRMVMWRGKLRKRWANQSPCGADSTPPSVDRWKIRSRTHAGIADAFAAQWFNPLEI